MWSSFDPVQQQRHRARVSLQLQLVCPAFPLWTDFTECDSHAPSQTAGSTHWNTIRENHDAPASPPLMRRRASSPSSVAATCSYPALLIAPPPSAQSLPRPAATPPGASPPGVTRRRSLATYRHQQPQRQTARWEYTSVYITSISPGYHTTTACTGVSPAPDQLAACTVHPAPARPPWLTSHFTLHRRLDRDLSSRQTRAIAGESAQCGERVR